MAADGLGVGIGRCVTIFYHQLAPAMVAVVVVVVCVCVRVRVCVCARAAVVDPELRVYQVCVA